MVAADEDRVVGVTVDAVVAYGFASGKEVWRVRRPSLPSRRKGKKKERQSTRGIPPIGTHNIGMLIVNRGRVYFGQPHGQGKVSNLIPMTLVCLQAANGKELWRKEVSDWTYTTSLNAYAVGETLVVHGSGRRPSVQVLDAATGKVLKEHDISAVNSQHHHRCYRNKATENYILMGKEGVEYLDIRTGDVTVNRWVRGACLYGILPANGLLYTTPAACACNQMNRLDGFNALAADAPATKAVHPFTRGPAYGTVGEPLPPYAWPQFRRDVLRSGATDLKPGTGGTWQVKLSGPLTAPVSDGARLFLGCNRDVLALDVADGKVLWRAPGPIDSPPTLHRGLLLYGTRDGWVHCRRADDGELAWRFRAAPEERLILDDDRIESVWPLHGSLLLFGGRVYAVAGRTTFLDGGLRLFALHPETGKVEASSVFRTEQTRQIDYYEGVTNDVLVTDGKSIFLKHMKIDPQTLAVHRQAWWQFSGPDGKLKSYAKPGFALPVQAERTPVLSSASGFLDDELFGRAHVQLDGAEFFNRLCFDENRAYGIRHSRGPGHFQFHLPGKEGFPVLCFERKSTKAKPKVDARTRRRQKGSGSVPADYRVLWRHKLPLRPSALVAAGDHFYLGGGPDEVDPDDPLASSEWRAGGLLYVLLRSDGTTVARQELSAPPVHEGILPLPTGLFLVLRDGTVTRR
jgi:outer membrane protein assembly factor BamB